MPIMEKPVLAPAAISTTNLIIAMSSGLCGSDFLGVAELIVGPSEWFEPSPRPCIAGWRSVSVETYDVEFGRMAEQLAAHYVWNMVEDQHADAANLIAEIQKYIRPLDKRMYPRMPEHRIKFWEDENGNLCHDIAILNKHDELTKKIDPIRARVGFPETLTFSENDKTRERQGWFIGHLKTMNAILDISGIVRTPPLPEPKDAIPRITDKTLAGVVAKEFSK